MYMNSELKEFYHDKNVLHCATKEVQNILFVYNIVFTCTYLALKGPSSAVTRIYNIILCICVYLM